MKTQFKMTVIAAAVAAVASLPAMAEGNRHHHHGPDIDVEINVEKNVTENTVDNFYRTIRINGEAAAAAQDSQFIHANDVENTKLTNDASLSDDVASGASGNIGMNVAAGDTNVQDNAAALASLDAGFVFGKSTSDVAVDQASLLNTTMNSGVQNMASISDNAFANASGNIGVNVVAGTGNGQKNTMAASVSNAGVASATISSNQQSVGNSIRNEGRTEQYTDSVYVALKGGSFGFYKGSGEGSYSGSTSSSIDGSMDQIGDVYPDMWSGSSHPAGTNTGHFDLDTATQGGSDLNGDGGALAFGTNGMTSEGRESGSLGFEEQGAMLLGTVVSGQVATTNYVVVNAQNDASLSGSAFTAASGNIGVNVAAGTNNLQSNSLSMAVSCVTCAGATTGE